MTYGHDMAASTIPGSLFEELPTGVATSALSLSTNILATILVTYKAWYVQEFNICSLCG